MVATAFYLVLAGDMKGIAHCSIVPHTQDRRGALVIMSRPGNRPRGFMNCGKVS